jgi:lysozyme
MQTGWIKSPFNGKLYYLNPISNGFKGAMMTNLSGVGFRIGPDGARIDN